MALRWKEHHGTAADGGALLSFGAEAAVAEGAAQLSFGAEAAVAEGAALAPVVALLPVPEPAASDPSPDVSLRWRSSSATRYVRIVKPVLDRLLAAVALPLVAPVLIVVAVVVRVTLGSPVLFRQTRVGLRGRTFTMVKFRTMHPDRRQVRRRWDGVDRRVRHKTPDDPRLVPVGRFLRKWSLDELPQLLNVLGGSMSLVGPRPELVEVVARYQPWQHARHEIKPGVTGLWQVTRRRDGLMHEHTDLDLAYLERVSFWRDCRILLLTMPAILGFGFDSARWLPPPAVEDAALTPLD